jgi:nucleotide-binding universal stress UspA family protein
MYKKMLVLLDGSTLSEVVFTYAQELSGRLCLDLELLHVCNTQEAEQLPMRQAYMEHMAEVLQKKAEEVRSNCGDTSQDHCIAVKSSVVVGYPPEEILKYIDQNEIDIVMLSTHGRSGIRAWDLGSVASKVIHAAKIPVWLVPSELREEVISDKIPMRTMVIPLDGSKLSEQVIPHAINIAKQRGAESEMVLVFVDNDIVGVPMNQEALNLRKENLAVMQKYLDTKVEEIKAAGIQARSKILTGNPAEAIIDFVKYNPPQLIAMATSSHTGLSRMLFGSVTENVINLIKKTPIFLIRPQA